MAKVKVPIFIVEATTSNGQWTPIEWQSRAKTWLHGRADGKPTDDNLKLWVEKFEASTQPGGVNTRLGVTRILTAKIKDQRNGNYLASFTRT